MADSSVPNSPAAPASADKEMEALANKHHIEIDRIKDLDSAHQMEAFRNLGVDPGALESHYKDLQKESIELRRQDVSANRKVVAAGWMSFFAGMAGMFALTRKRFKPDSNLVRGFMVGLSGPAAGIAGTKIASSVIAAPIRERSAILDVEARDAVEREAVVAIENQERMRKATGATPRREESFASQAAAEKAAPPASGRAV